VGLGGSASNRWPDDELQAVFPPVTPGTPFALSGSNGFAKEDSVRFKKSIAWKRSARLNKFMRRMRLKEFNRLPMKIRAGAIAGVVMIVTTAVMLIAARQPSSSARGDRPLEKTSHAVAYTTANTPAMESPARPAVAKLAPVTITGCLERDDRTFRLKDTTGANAPKSRSWKTAFLKKGSASIQVVDAANRLRDHVGQRVSVTGVLVNREMQVRSLQRVAPSCTSSSRVKI
jgi:hypothetical protein